MGVHRRAWVGCLAAVAAMLVPALPASAAGSHGPLAQTARDNALAPTRRSATPGTFGPDLCIAGFVWREALPGDRVCVSLPPGSRCTTTT